VNAAPDRAVVSGPAAQAGAGTPDPAVVRGIGADEPLQRVIGTRTLAAAIVNMIVGSGIFVLPASVAGVLGPAAILAYVACAVVIGLIALCFAECGSRVAASGGAFAYIEVAFGRYPGVLAGALGYLSNVVASAAVATVLVGSIGGFWPVFAEPVPRAALVIVLYGALTALNLRGVGAGARLVEFATFVKLAPLVLLAAFGALHSTAANFTGFEWPTAGELGSATLLLVFAFIGVEAALQNGGEVRDPARTVPRAVALGMLAVAALYGALQFAAQGVLGAALPAEQAPLAAVARAIAGAPGGTLVLIAATISTFGYVAGDMLCSPRQQYALARSSALPAVLARVHPRTLVPRTAIVTHAALCCGLALSTGFEPLALLTVVATLLLYGGCALATLRLRQLGARLEAAPFVIPGGPVVPVAALAVTLWLLAQATWQEFAACSAAVAFVTVLYGLKHWRRRA
jgi:amino acid transporter